MTIGIITSPPSLLSSLYSPTHMDDITGKWAQLSFNTKETQTMDLAPNVVNNSRVLMARLFTKCRVNIEALVRTLRSMWHSV